MPTFSRQAAVGRAHGRRQCTDIGQSIRHARRSAGLSQRAVAKAARISQAHLSKLERGLAGPTITTVAAIASVVGLDLSMRTFPGGSPLRDAGHVRVLARLRALLPATYRWRTEVPIPITGDRRAIDAMVADPPIAAGFELETRFGDAQSTDRRILIKQRDAGLSAMILVVPDTRHNRLAVAAAAPTIRASFPLDGRQVLRALRAGVAPSANGILFV